MENKDTIKQVEHLFLEVLDKHFKQQLIDEQIRRWKHNKKVWDDFNDENSYEFKYGDLFVPLTVKERYLPMVIPNKEK